MKSQTLAENRAENMPNMRTSGSFSKRSTSKILLRTVLVTDAPRRTAPPNSQKLAIMTACLRVIDLAETEEAKALATSLAPMRKPYMKPTRPPSTATQRYSVRAAMIRQQLVNQISKGMFVKE